MIFRSKFPTKAGFYWFIEPDTDIPQIVELFYHASILYFMGKEDNYFDDAKEHPGLWGDEIIIPDRIIKEIA